MKKEDKPNKIYLDQNKRTRSNPYARNYPDGGLAMTLEELPQRQLNSYQNSNQNINQNITPPQFWENNP